MLGSVGFIKKLYLGLLQRGGWSYFVIYHIVEVIFEVHLILF